MKGSWGQHLGAALGASRCLSGSAGPRCWAGALSVCGGGCGGSPCSSRMFAVCAFHFAGGLRWLFPCTSISFCGIWVGCEWALSRGVGRELGCRARCPALSGLCARALGPGALSGRPGHGGPSLPPARGCRPRRPGPRAWSSCTGAYFSGPRAWSSRAGGLSFGIYFGFPPQMFYIFHVCVVSPSAFYRGQQASTKYRKTMKSYRPNTEIIRTTQV